MKKLTLVTLLFVSFSLVLGLTPTKTSAGDITWQQEYNALMDGKYYSHAYSGGMAESHPVFVDIDADNDLDMFIGSYYGNIYFYQNDGTPKIPFWTFVTENYNSIELEWQSSAPAFVDIDGDNDYDMFIEGDGLRLYENAGTPQDADWILIPGDYNSISDGAPNFVDIDNDGDYDMFITLYYSIEFYQNDGTPQAANWRRVTSNYNSIDLDSGSHLNFVDIDGDNDYDMFIDEYDGNINFYQNNGTPENASWILVTENYNSINVDYYSFSAFEDIDNDSDFDMFIGKGHGGINFYQNNGSSFIPNWTLITESYLSIDVGWDSNPAFIDIDNDNDYDMFIGNSNGDLKFYQNDGTVETPSWTNVRGAFNPKDLNLKSAPNFVDIDNDGDQDIFMGEGHGGINFHRNMEIAQNTHPIITGIEDIDLEVDVEVDNIIDLWNHSYDAESDHNELTYTITANTNPECGITIDANRYIDIAPDAGWLSSSNVTIRVEDPEGKYFDSTFTVTVTLEPDLPINFDVGDIRINTVDGTTRWTPMMLCDNNYVYFLWRDLRNDPDPTDNTEIRDIYFRKYNIKLEEWADEIAIASNPCNIYDEAGRRGFCTDGNGNIYILWKNETGLLFKRSHNSGQTWQDDQLVIDQAGIEGDIYASWTACDDKNNVYLIYGIEKPDMDILSVYFIKSTDKGETWSDSPTFLQDLNYIPADFGGSIYIIPPGLRFSSNNNGNLYLMWNEYNVDDYDIYLSYSSDYGENWNLSPIKVNSNNSMTHQWNFSIECNDLTNAYVIWGNGRDGADDIFLNKTDDGGETWLESDIRIDADSPWENASIGASLECDDLGNVYVAWTDERHGIEGRHSIFFNCSHDFGLTWKTEDIRIDKNPEGGTAGYAASLSNDNTGSVYAIWADIRNSADSWYPDIYLNYSNDAGENWLEQDMKVNNTSPENADERYLVNPCVSDKGDIYVSWGQGRVIDFPGDVDWDLFFTYSRSERNEVTGRHIFYNNSAFDGESDNDAIATDKQALLPGQLATFANYTSYSGGINGIMVGIENLSDPDNLNIETVENYFQFNADNTMDPTTWPDAPSPIEVSVTQLPDTTTYRIKLIWEDNAIMKEWLQIKVLANANTGLQDEDVFYFGNAIGECGNAFQDADPTNNETKVNATDMLSARNNTRNFLNPAPIDFVYDYNRDKKVNAVDMLIARNNQTHFRNALKLLDLRTGLRKTIRSRRSRRQFSR